MPYKILPWRGPFKGCPWSFEAQMRYKDNGSKVYTEFTPTGKRRAWIHGHRVPVWLFVRLLRIVIWWARCKSPTPISPS